jgi:hypothetical protein
MPPIGTPRTNRAQDSSGDAVQSDEIRWDYKTE